MPTKLVMLDTAREAEITQAILGPNYRVLSFPLRPGDLASISENSCCYLMAESTGAGEVRCLRAQNALRQAGFPVERIYRAHIARPISRKQHPSLWDEAFRLPVPVHRNLAEAAQLQDRLESLIARNPVALQPISHWEAQIAAVLAGDLAPEAVSEALQPLERRPAPAHSSSSLPATSSATPCPSCSNGRIVERASTTGTPLFGCSRFPRCRFLAFGRPIDEVCPLCTSPYLIEKHLQRASWAVCPVRSCKFRRPLKKSQA